MWAALGVLGALAVVTGLLPVADARAVAVTRGGPIMVFLVAITVLAELADRAGVFDAAAGMCARVARGSTVRLFLLVAALATVITVGMSLDTTAVLLTPVVLALAFRLGLSPRPFVFLVVWLANTASLLLPVSNLTNLLAVQHLHLSTVAFATRMVLPEVVAVVITVAYLGLVYRHDLTGRYELPQKSPTPDRVLFWVCAASCAFLAPAVLAGVAPWRAATVSATVCATAFGWRQRSGLSWSLLPWRIVIFTEGLFLLVTTIARHGGSTFLGDLIGNSTLAASVTAAVSSNAVNNLPAYLATETVVSPTHPTQLFAVLIGTNTGPLILLWGSLATILWRERCAARGVSISARRFAAIGLGGVPLVLLGTWAALLINHQ